MVCEADEAAGLSPGNGENEAERCFSPEKPRLPLSIEGNILYAIFSLTTQNTKNRNGSAALSLQQSRCLNPASYAADASI